MIDNTQFIKMERKYVKSLQEIKKNDEEYKILLERKKTGESVDDLIKKNRDYAEILAKKHKENSEESKKWHQSKHGRKWNAELQREIQSNAQMKKLIQKVKKKIKEIMENAKEYEYLLQRKKAGELVEDLIIQNRNNEEVLRNNYKKIGEEAKEWAKMNLDWFLDSRELQNFMIAFSFSLSKYTRKEKKKAKKKRKQIVSDFAKELQKL